MKKVAFISGATRGIGKACAVRLAKEGWDIAVAGHSVAEGGKLPGTIYSTAEEITALGVKAVAIPCDLTRQESIDAAVAQTVDAFGRVDVLVNNAGALWWRTLEETPMKRFDLVMNINVRGSFALTQGFLPAMRSHGGGHIIFMSPPIDLTVLPGHIAYSVSKFGMTMIAMGLAEELKGTAIYATALWPKTAIESSATIVYNLGRPELWRKPEIISDAMMEILARPDETNGKALIDEDFLRSVGYTDFDQYNCVPGGKPLELTPELMRYVRS